MVKKGGTTMVFAEGRHTLRTAKIHPQPWSCSKLIWTQAAQVPWSELALLPVGNWIDNFTHSF